MRTSSNPNCREGEDHCEEKGGGGSYGGSGRGKLYLVGIGPGDLEHLSRKAYEVVRNVEVIVGYDTYIDLLEEIISSDQIVYSTGMKGEVERAKKAVELASKGKEVAVVSSGDPGIYGMAGLVLEVISDRGIDLETEVVPGITSASAAAASLGAPLVNDFAAVSLSDIMTPWEKICDRLRGAAKADFVTALYNPRSKNREDQIKTAREIFLNYRKNETPVGIIRNAKRGREDRTITTLEGMLDAEIDMLTTVIIGNSETFVSQDRMITPRGYEL